MKILLFHHHSLLMRIMGLRILKVEELPEHFLPTLWQKATSNAFFRRTTSSVWELMGRCICVRWVSPINWAHGLVRGLVDTMWLTDKLLDSAVHAKDIDTQHVLDGNKLGSPLNIALVPLLTIMSRSFCSQKDCSRRVPFLSTCHSSRSASAWEIASSEYHHIPVCVLPCPGFRFDLPDPVMRGLKPASFLPSDHGYRLSMYWCSGRRGVVWTTSLISV